MLVQLDRWLTATENVGLALGTAVAVALAAVQVALRYVGGTGFFWAEELTVYIVVWTAFIAAGAGVRSGEHLCVELIGIVVGPRHGRGLLRAIALVGAAASAALAVYGTQFVLAAREFEQLSPALQVPMWIVYLAVPVGGVLMTLRFGLRLGAGTVPADARPEGGEWH